MTREIKFRAWNFEKNKMLKPETLSEIIFGKWRRGDKWNWKIMQFTGLLDKNGKEIYEGDIVKVVDDLGVVKYSYNSFVIYLENGSIADDYFAEWEVIGNIYENPELLEA